MEKYSTTNSGFMEVMAPAQGLSLHFNQRSKWCKEGFQFSVNDVVLIKDDNTPPTKWLMGRIVATYPGKDNITRVVKVKTTKNEIIRPVVKLVKLPVKRNEESAK